MISEFNVDDRVRYVGATTSLGLVNSDIYVVKSVWKGKRNIELHHIPGAHCDRNFKLVKSNSMCKFKVGQRIRRVMSPVPHLGMINGNIYTVKTIAPNGNITVYECKTDELWNSSFFEAVPEEVKPTFDYKKQNRPFGQWKIKEKLEVIEEYLRGKQIEYSSDEHNWKNLPLNNKSCCVYWDDSLFYRVKDTSEVVEEIEQVQEQINELNKRLDVLKTCL